MGGVAGAVVNPDVVNRGGGAVPASLCVFFWLLVELSFALFFVCGVVNDCQFFLVVDAKEKFWRKMLCELSRRDLLESFLADAIALLLTAFLVSEEFSLLAKRPTRKFSLKRIRYLYITLRLYKHCYSVFC